jgi:hypothetical protein
MFCLVSAGHERKDRAFTVEALVEHLHTHLKALRRLEQNGYSFPDRSITLLSTPACRPLAERIAAAVDSERIAHGLLGHEYYAGLRFMVNARAPDGSDVPLIDGGAFDWLHKLASNRKLALVASGMGSQLAAYLFRSPGSPADRGNL